MIDKKKNIKKTTIIIGAGASADFSAKKQQDILAEILQGENGQLIKKPDFQTIKNLTFR